MKDRQKVLLLAEENTLSQAVQKTLQEAGFAVTTSPPTRKQLPKGRYEYLIQMGTDPTTLTEGTRRLLEKAKKERAEFLLVSNLRASTPKTEKATYLESLHFAEALTREFHQKHGLKTIILRLPTIFGPGIPLDKSGTLGHLIAEFASGEPTLTIYGEGKDCNYYLYLTDATEAIKEALAITDKEGTISLAAPPTPLSSATIAEILVKMGGGRQEIHYHKGLITVEEEIKLEGKKLPHFKPRVSLKEGVLQTLKALPDGREKQVRHNLTLPRFRRPSKKALIQLAVILLILSPFLYIGGQISLATYHLAQLRRQIGTFDFLAANHTAGAIRTDLNSFNRVLGSVPFLSRKTPLRDLRLISQGGSEAAAALAGLLAEGETILTTFENLFKSHRGEAIKEQTEEEFKRLATAFGEAEDKLLAAWLYLDQTHPSFQNLVTPYLSLLQEGLTATRLGAALAAAAPDLLGYQGERSYLILFQNSGELWAGGGAVTSLAHLSLKEGGIKTLEFYDLYDFQNVKDVEEEKPTFFGSGNRSPIHIALSPNFPNNAKFAAKVFEQATEVAIDGAIGVDLHFAEKLLTITGPLQLIDFEVKVTPENLFEVAETEVEKEFFPGSTKKKRFMQALGEGILTKLFAIERGDYAKIAQLAWGQLQGKGILLYFANPELYQAAIENNFAGLVRAAPGDYLFPLDHNTGTKGTVWVKREITYRVYNSDREGTLQSELIITWRNEGTSSWPAGKYGNAFRVLVPKGVRLVSAHLDSEDVAGKIFVAEEVSKGEFGIRFEIAPQTARTLKLIYDLPKNLNLKNLPTYPPEADKVLDPKAKGSYKLTVQKQPGMVGDSFTFVFEEPFGKQISSKTLQREDSTLILKKNLERDITLEVLIGEKEKGEAL